MSQENVEVVRNSLRAFADGGLTAYRQDVADQAKIHLSKLAA